jgi:hypothetical protein
MQPRLLVFALIAACLWAGCVGLSTRPGDVIASAPLLRPSSASSTDTAQFNCLALEEDAADDLRLLFLEAPAVVNMLQPCARSEAVHSFAPIFCGPLTLESQHIVLQV